MTAFARLTVTDTAQCIDVLSAEQRMAAAIALAYDRPHGRGGMANDKTQPRAALITGAGRRIGRAIALTLAQAGYAVALHAHRSRADAEKLAGEIASAGGKARVVLADLADADAVAKLVPAAAAFGPLTLLVNNASQFDEDEIGSLERTMAVNLSAPVFLAQAFAAQAPEGADPSIVNIVDQRVLKPTPRFFSYTLSKSALASATVTLAQALAPKLRVNAVAPGPTLPSPRQSVEQFATQAAAVPLQRGPSPEDIAAAVFYLAQATSVTGTVIAVDGGQHLAWRTIDSDARGSAPNIIGEKRAWFGHGAMAAYDRGCVKTPCQLH
jgi:NAD(P)-dependent dehydrogenase (short-subunit alcohol dehydrogenase family)